MRDASSRKGIEFKSAEPWLCTDNAAMIAFAALLRLRAGFESHVTEEIDPNSESSVKRLSACVAKRHSQPGVGHSATSVCSRSSR